jgi:hypothetical protein
MEYKADAFLRTSGYIPPRNQWTPAADETLYSVDMALNV